MDDYLQSMARSLEKGKKRALDEELRLAYVAIIRAMKEFYMTETECINPRESVRPYRRHRGKLLQEESEPNRIHQRDSFGRGPGGRVPTQ